MCIFSKHFIDRYAQPTSGLEERISRKTSDLSSRHTSLATFDFSLFKQAIKDLEESTFENESVEVKAYRSLLKHYRTNQLVPKQSDELRRLEVDFTLEKTQKVQDIFFSLISDENLTHHITTKSFFLEHPQIWSSINLYLEQIVTKHQMLSDKQVRAVNDYCPFSSISEKKQYNQLLNLMCQGLSRIGYCDEAKQKLHTILFSHLLASYSDNLKKLLFIKKPTFEEAKALYDALQNQESGEEILQKLREEFVFYYPEFIPKRFSIEEMYIHMIKFASRSRDSTHLESLKYSCSFYKTLSYLLPIGSCFIHHPFLPQDLPLPVFDFSAYKQPQLFVPRTIEIHHLMNVDGYLKHRFSETCLHFLKKHSDKFEVFLGPKEDLAAFYRINEDLYLNFSFTNPCSTQIFVLTNLEGEVKKIVFHKIYSLERLHHVFYELQLAQIKIESMITRGSLDTLHAKEYSGLVDWIHTLEKKPEILFMGSSLMSRKNEVSYLAPTKKDPAKYEGLTKGIALDFNAPGKEIFRCLNFTMPYGKLAYVLAEACLDAGVKTIVLLGAGGALGSDLIGAYSIINSALLNGTALKIPQEALLCPVSDDPSFVIINRADKIHLNVNSPLEETNQWISQAHKLQAASVDVEASYVIQTFLEHYRRDHSLKILPGVFISDIVDNKELTLEKKISPEKGMKNVGSIVNWVITHTP